MSVYGDMMSYFPELFRPVSFWERNPLIGGGYEDTERKQYNVVILADAQAQFQNKKATDYRAIDYTNRDVMYSVKNTPIQKGMFLEHPDDKDIYVVDEPFDYSFTGGFKMWGIERVQGATSDSQPDAGIKQGVF